MRLRVRVLPFKGTEDVAKGMDNAVKGTKMRLRVRITLPRGPTMADPGVRARGIKGAES